MKNFEIKNETEPSKVNQSEVIQHDISQFPIEKSMRSLLQKGNHLNQDIVYSTLFQELPDEEIIDKVEQDYGREKAQQMIREVELQLGHAYIRLLIEPSIGCRFNDFISFSIQLKSKGNLPDPSILRNEFKDSLKKIKVYRVVAATENNLNKILDEGFISNFYRGKTKEELLKNQDFYQSMDYNMVDLRGRVNIHAGGYASTKDSTLISVSEYPEIAEYAAFVQLKDRWDDMKKQGYKLYSFPIEINEFYCLRYSEYLPKHIKGNGNWTDGKTTIDYNDPGIESFIEFQISKDKINHKEIKEVDIDKITTFKFIPNGEKYN